MRKTIISALAALVLAAGADVATTRFANAQADSCFTGDTMARDGNHTGALGAAKCTAEITGLSDGYAVYRGDRTTVVPAARPAEREGGDAALYGIGH